MAPQHFALKDHRVVTIRHLTADDAGFLVEMYDHLSQETIKNRFHIQINNPTDAQIWEKALDLCNLNPAVAVAIAATAIDADGEHIVGVARLCRKTQEDTMAEVAVTVRDDFQNMGLGTFLMQELAKTARAMGIDKFQAWMLAENRVILHVANKYTAKAAKQVTSRGETYIEIPLN